MNNKVRARESILVVEDEPKMRRLLELRLGEEGYTVHSAADAEAGMNLLSRENPSLVLTDFRLPGMDGLEFLQAVKRVNAQLPVVVMTAHGSVESAVEAMKIGASDYLLKPFSFDELVMIIRKELDSHQLRDENRSLREAVGLRYSYENIVAVSDKMQKVLALVERVAATNATVLIGGESGVGKDLVARAIHEHSQRASGPFVKINSTAIPETLLESELFGYDKGAFSGATTSKPGKFELADKGTLFLDEIGDVPGAMQVKLLRVLQDREFERLGGVKTLKVDVRMIAATNRDLRAALEEGTFREDLYYRLNVVPIDIPPLRERKEDIPPLARFFLERYGLERYGRESQIPAKGFTPPAFTPQAQAFTPQAMKRLIDFHWPGNVRELENIVQRAVTLSTGPVLDVVDIHIDYPVVRSLNSSAPVLPDGMTLEHWEDEIIREAMRRANGNKSQAARTLGLSRNALRYRLSKLGVPDTEDTAEEIKDASGGRPDNSV